MAQYLYLGFFVRLPFQIAFHFKSKLCLSASSPGSFPVNSLKKVLRSFRTNSGKAFSAEFSLGCSLLTSILESFLLKISPFPTPAVLVDDHYLRAAASSGNQLFLQLCPREVPKRWLPNTSNIFQLFNPVLVSELQVPWDHFWHALSASQLKLHY